MGALLFPRVNAIPWTRRERMDTSDGDFVDIEVHEGSDPDAPVVILCHGLESSGDSRSIAKIANGIRSLTQDAWHMYSIHFRGCSKEPNRTFRAYTAGFTGDLREVLEFIRKKKQFNPVYLSGFSLGGNVILK